MPLTNAERRALAQEFAVDIRRMHDCLQENGYQSVSDDMLVQGWSDYSKGMCVTWLSLSGDDTSLLEILRRHISQLSPAGITPNLWHTKMRDAEDGTGDGILEIPDELMSQLGWKLGDELHVTVNDVGELVLRRAV